MEFMTDDKARTELLKHSDTLKELGYTVTISFVDKIPEGRIFCDTKVDTVKKSVNIDLLAGAYPRWEYFEAAYALCAMAAEQFERKK